MFENEEAAGFAEQLEALFRQSGLKADFVAAKVGISPSYLSRLRNGKATNPGFHVVGALAAVFNVSPGYFFGDPEVPVINDIALLASSLDERGQKILKDMIAYINSLQVRDEPQDQVEPDC